MPFDLQPVLKGELLELGPLRPEDFEDLFAVASDPLIWEQHPANDRYKVDVFNEFFRQAMESGGALIAIDLRDGRVIGSSRFNGYDETQGEIEIGWTFLARSHWGGVYNREMKRLMLQRPGAQSPWLLTATPLGPMHWLGKKNAIPSVDGMKPRGSKPLAIDRDPVGADALVGKEECDPQPRWCEAPGEEHTRGAARGEKSLDYSNWPRLPQRLRFWCLDNRGAAFLVVLSHRCYASRMVSPRRIFSRIIAAAQRFAARFRAPAMIGTPPSARPLWHDPAAHARDFAARYAAAMDYHVAQRMTELGIRRIGMPDRDAGIAWAAFHSHGTVGGSYAPDGRLIADSGVFNLELLKNDYGTEASSLFERSRLRDRLDSIIAHEFEEHRDGMDHAAALKAAPETGLRISERAREICRAMEMGWRRK